MAGKWLPEHGCPDPTPGCLELSLLFSMTGTSSSTHELLYFVPSLLANTLLTQMHLLWGAWLDHYPQSYRVVFPCRRHPHPPGLLFTLFWLTLTLLCVGPVVSRRAYLDGMWASSACTSEAVYTALLMSSWLGSIPSLDETH